MGKKIRLLALDLDGTLLNGAKQITPRTQAALERARQQGVLMVPVTGRPAQGLPPAVLSLPGLRYAVTSNGATIRDLVEQRVLLEKHLAPALCLQVLARCAHIPMIRQVFRRGWAISPGRTMRPSGPGTRGRPCCSTTWIPGRSCRERWRNSWRRMPRRWRSFSSSPTVPRPSRPCGSASRTCPGIGFADPFPNDLEVIARGD